MGLESQLYAIATYFQARPFFEPPILDCGQPSHTYYTQSCQAEFGHYPGSLLEMHSIYLIVAMSAYRVHGLSNSDMPYVYSLRLTFGCFLDDNLANMPPDVLRA